MYRRTFPRKRTLHVSQCTIPSQSVPCSDLQTYLDAGIAPQQSPMLHSTKDEFDTQLNLTFDEVAALACHNPEHIPDSSVDSGVSASVEPSV